LLCDYKVSKSVELGGHLFDFGFQRDEEVLLKDWTFFLEFDEVSFFLEAPVLEGNT